MALINFNIKNLFLTNKYYNPPMNLYTKLENYTNKHQTKLRASKLGYINSISIAKYDNPNQKIGNDIVIPTTLYRIYYNNDAKFEKCFKYENKLDVDWKNDKLRDHEVDCKSIKIK